MNRNLPIKSSSRSGRFKKKLVSETELLLEGPMILEKVGAIHDLFRLGRMTSVEFVAAYIIMYLSHRYPKTWAGSKIQGKSISGFPWRDLPLEFGPNVIKRLEGIHSLQEIFSHFALKSTPLSVNKAIINWHEGHYQLELMFRIPSPQEVLMQQKHGRRCVTALVDKKISSYILGDRDALSFTLHDLIHADHFYHNKECYEGQLGFYGLLDKTFSYFDLSKKEFASEFEYVISDMNAYAIHLLKCLKSSMIHYFNHSYFEEWLRLTDAPPEMAHLNTTAYSPIEMDHRILEWLRQFKAIHAINGVQQEYT